MAIETVTSYGINRITHTIPVTGLCPKTGEPQPSSVIIINYEPSGYVLEYYSLAEFVTSFAGSKTVRDLEQLVMVVRNQCQTALGGVAVSVTGKFRLEMMDVEITA